MRNLSLRSVSWLAFFGIVIAAWWQMYAMSTGMGLDLLGRPAAMADAMRGMDPMSDMAMPMASYGPLFTMWAVMMAAMMLPTMVPTLSTYEDLIGRAGGTRGGWIGVVMGFFLVWAGFAGLIAGAQIGLLRIGAIDMLGIATSKWLAGGLLVGVGLYQFTRAKEVCHGVCHSPMVYFLGQWRTGFGGGLRMGAGLGAFCVGCCWGFMALGFVGGVMSLAWMGLATLFMVIEKLPQVGHVVTRPMGALLVAAGLALPFLTN